MPCRFPEPVVLWGTRESGASTVSENKHDNDRNNGPRNDEHTDQLTFRNPVTRYPAISPPEQRQPGTGLDIDLSPATDRGQHSYRGTGRLEGRKALITGGDSGIGAAVAIAFAREGADVALNYLPEEEADARWVRSVIEASGRAAHLIPGDISDRGMCLELVEVAVGRLGGLDALVNNAGVQTSVPEFEDLADEQWQRTYDVNIHAMFRITRAALKYLPAGSTVVNSTSVQAYSPAGDLIDYASTKAAVNNFTKGLSQQLAHRGIRVNAVAPGPFWSPLQVSGGQQTESLPWFGGQTALGRAGQPTEVAPAYVFLTSPESSFVVGETLNVNGGMPTP